MNEVSCKALWLWFEVARQRGIDPARYVTGLPTTVEFLAKPSNRIDWDLYCSLIERLQSLVGGPEEFERVSHLFLLAPSVNVRSVIGLVTSPRTLYWVAHRWFGHAMFTIVESTFNDVGPNEIDLTLRIPDGYRDSPGFFRMNAGVFRANPRILDLVDATVDFTLGPRLGTYRIRHPPSMTLPARVRRAFRMIFAAGAAFNELGSQQEELKRGYFRLETANKTIERKTHELEVVSVVTAAAHSSLGLDEALRAICVQVCGQLGYEYARFAVACTQDGVAVAHTAEHGKLAAEPAFVAAPLSFRGTALGELSAARTAPISDEERRFFGEVANACALAINNAVAFEVIKTYRRSLEDRVVERTAQLQSALEQVKVQSAARQRIFQNISHELRTPLSLIGLSTGDVLYRDGDRLTGKSKQRLDQIDDSIERLLHLFDGMLLLAAGQEGKLRIRPTHTDLAITLSSLVSAWHVAAEKHRINLSYAGADRLSVQVDSAAIERAVTNLISNAIKFTSEGGSIDVRLEEDGPDRVRIAVQDTGIGMEQEFLSRVFGRFEQGPAPVRSGERGSGIGLAIVKEIAEAHGGTATVDSERGRGSTFFVTLPRTQDLEKLAAQGEGSYVPELRHTVPVANSEIQATADASPSNRTARHTLLVAEDDPSLRQFLVELLSREYRVIAASDGLAALRLAKEHQPSLLVSDIGMPGIDGIELTRRFRATCGDKLAPVILLTAYALAESRLQGLEAGAIDYVTKPFHPDELLVRIRGQLQLREMALRLLETQKLAGLGVLSAGLAHELRNPANGVVAALVPLKRMLPPELLKPDTPTGMLLEAMTQGADQITVLTRQLLGFSRQGELSVSEEPVLRILDSAQALMEGALNGFKLKRDLGYVDTVTCARGLVVQVLVNLLENAVHASPPGGEITIATRLENGQVLIEVHDSGKGVPKELRDRIFDPFFTTKPPGHGTGLGLSISRMIAERQGGSLRLLEGERCGAFRLELPQKKGVLPTTSPVLERVAIGGLA